MKLTSKILERLILEEIENTHIPFKSDYEREQHLRKQQEEKESHRQKEKEIRPDYDLMKLSKGILQEQELLGEPDKDGYVRIKASALQRVLTEQKADIEHTCKPKKESPRNVYPSPSITISNQIHLLLIGIIFWRIEVVFFVI